MSDTVIPPQSTHPKEMRAGTQQYHLPMLRAALFTTATEDATQLFTTGK